MRIWSLHPRYLDRQGLTACWREALLAQAVLAGTTRGYTRHPQLERFRTVTDPVSSIGDYLAVVSEEASTRGYRFDLTRVRRQSAVPEVIPVTTGQLALEWAHLRVKLALRDPRRLAAFSEVTVPEPHPLFSAVDGPVAPWERAVPGDAESPAP